MVSDTTTHPTIVSDRALAHELEAEERHYLLFGHSHVGWGAIIAGALASLAFLALLTSFASACGIPTYRGGTFGAGAFIWLCFSSLLAFFFGGWISGYLAPRHEPRASGMLHGLMAWVLGTVLIISLAAGAIGPFHGVGAGDEFRYGLMPLAGEATHAQIVGAAWGAFVALALSLITAAIGGVIGSKLAPRLVKVA